MCACLCQIFYEQSRVSPKSEALTRFDSSNGLASVLGGSRLGLFQQMAPVPSLTSRFMSTQTNSVESSNQDSSTPDLDVPQRIKFKRLDKTAKHIMQASG